MKIRAGSHVSLRRWRELSKLLLGGIPCVWPVRNCLSHRSVIVLVDLGLGLALDHVDVVSLLPSEVRDSGRSVLHEAIRVISHAGEAYSLHCKLLLLLLTRYGS